MTVNLGSGTTKTTLARSLVELPFDPHGVFTWALLDALRHGDANGNGTIELSELAAHVQNLVPELGAELGSLARGWAVVGPTTAPPSTLPTAQTARFGSRGEDFVIAGRLQ
jgi:uncharacterized caspase-like protein